MESSGEVSWEEESGKAGARVTPMPSRAPPFLHDSLGASAFTSAVRILL